MLSHPLPISTTFQRRSGRTAVICGLLHDLVTHLDVEVLAWPHPELTRDEARFVLAQCVADRRVKTPDHVAARIELGLPVHPIQI